MKLLFLGNSYTYYNEMPELFEKLAQENGHSVHVFSVTCGGHKLCEYADGDDEYTQRIAELIKAHSFDVCFLQEQSLLPVLDEECFRGAVKKLVTQLGESVKHFVLYATWGRKPGSAELEKHGWTSAEMTELLKKAYQRAADEIGADVSPVGVRFAEVRNAYPEIELYAPDLSHPSYAGSCLAALTHYRTVFGVLPESTDCLKLPKETIAVLCGVVNAQA